MRSAVAKQHGLDEQLVDDARDRAETITDAQLAALDLTDALIADPAGIGTQLRQRVRAHYSNDQIIELCLDVMKWSYQKVAVALHVDKEIRPGELSDLVFDEAGRWVRSDI